jgi:uncharacterized protein (TIGR02246 family)
VAAAPSDHDEIRRVLARYCQLCDDGEFDEFALLFTDSATFTVMGTTHDGRGQIEAFMRAAQPPESRGKHLISQPVIEIDGDTARVTTDYAFVGRVGSSLAITSSGRYVDRFERVDGQWAIAAREIVFLP